MNDEEQREVLSNFGSKIDGLTNELTKAMAEVQARQQLLLLELQEMRANLSRYAFSKEDGAIVPKREQHRKAIHREIVDYIRRMQIPESIKGHLYLVHSIKALLNHECILHEPEDLYHLYGKLAQIHSTTPSRVERAIEYAIHIAFTRGFGFYEPGQPNQEKPDVFDVFQYLYAYFRQRSENVEVELK